MGRQLPGTLAQGDIIPLHSSRRPRQAQQGPRMIVTVTLKERDPLAILALVDSLTVGSNCRRAERHCSLRFPQSTWLLGEALQNKPQDQGSMFLLSPTPLRTGVMALGPGKQSPGQTWQSPSKLCLLISSQPQAGPVQWLPGSPVQLGSWPGPLPEAKSSRELG